MHTLYRQGPGRIVLQTLPFLSCSPCDEHTESILHRITFLLSVQTLLSLSVRLALRVFRSINERSVVFHEMNALFIDINCSVQFAKVDLTMKILREICFAPGKTSPCSHAENGRRKFKRTVCASRISFRPERQSPEFRLWPS